MPKDSKTPSLAAEWSYLVEAEDITAEPMKLNISPSEADRNKLSKRLEILSLDDLQADLTLVREQGSMVVHVSGRFKARLRQQCVVTMEPVADEVEEDLEAWYADPDQAISLTKIRHDREALKSRGEAPVLDESEDPEPIVGEKIDVGELVTQYLSLSINPYPHAEGAHYEIGDDNKKLEKTPEIRKNPFTALKDWKARQE